MGLKLKKDQIIFNTTGGKTMGVKTFWEGRLGHKIRLKVSYI